MLTHHVIPGRLTPEELAGTHTTLNNDEVTIEGAGEDFTIAVDGTVTGMEASVICGNVQTANATVYIIDQVLGPPPPDRRPRQGRCPTSGRAAALTPRLGSGA